MGFFNASLNYLYHRYEGVRRARCISSLAAARSTELEELVDNLIRLLDETEETQLQTRVEVVSGLTKFQVDKRVVLNTAKGIRVDVPYDTSAGGEQIYKIVSDPAGDGNCAEVKITSSDDNVCVIGGAGDGAKVTVTSPSGVSSCFKCTGQGICNSRC